MPSGWDMSLTVVSAYGPNRSAEVPGLLAGPGIVLLGEFNAHVHCNSDTWRDVIGRKGLPNLNPSDVLLLDFCAIYSLSITKHHVQA